MWYLPTIVVFVELVVDVSSILQLMYSIMQVSFRIHVHLDFALVHKNSTSVCLVVSFNIDIWNSLPDGGIVGLFFWYFCITTFSMFSLPSHVCYYCHIQNQMTNPHHLHFHHRHLIYHLPHPHHQILWSSLGLSLSIIIRLDSLLAVGQSSSHSLLLFELVDDLQGSF